MTDAVFHAGQEPVQHGNQWGPSAVKGFGLARDLIARISAPDYSPWRMAALHSVDDLATDSVSKRRCREKASTPEEREERKRIQKTEHMRRLREMNDSRRVVRTPEELQAHMQALYIAKKSRAKARKAAAAVQVYAYPRGPGGRFLPKQPGEVWTSESFSASCQKQKTATGSN